MLEPLENLIHALAKLPGFGRRSSERAALALVRRPEVLLNNLIQALEEARDNVCLCYRCGAFTTHEANPCPLCTRSDREDTLLCVVEDPADIQLIEAAEAFKGRYHALMGKLSPGLQTGTSELRITELLERVRNEGIREIILALPTDLDGEATANYIAEKVRPYDVRVTRLAFGLPAGSAIAYADPLTLRRAIRGRQQLDDEDDIR